MRITRIEVRDFRKLRRPATLGGLADGITVVSGDNEEGKSTILKAVQAAFFDRHSLTGERHESMLPYGTVGATPTVEIVFQFGGQACRLVKSFKPRAAAALQIGGQTLHDDAVEDRLREMLRFTPPGKGAAKADHRGMWSLFWVEQGTAFDPLDLNDDARKSLDGTLQSQVGKVLGGTRGEKLREAVKALYEEHFTQQGRERGLVKTIKEKLAAIDNRRREARDALTSFDDKTDRLARIEARIAVRARENRVEIYADAVKAAKAKQADIETLRRRVAKAEADLKLAIQAAARATERWGERRKQAEDMAALCGTIAAAEAEAAEARRAFAASEKRRDELLARAGKAEAELAAADQAVVKARSAVDRGRAAIALRALDERLGRAEIVAAAITTADAEAATLGVDDKTWDKIVKFDKHADKARLQFESAAAAIVFRPDKGRAVHRDGAAVPADVPIVLTTAAAFTLDGFGAVEVRPGGGDDVTDLRKAHEKAAQSLAKALADTGAADLDEAARRHAQWTDLTRAAASDRAKLDGIAPDGLDALRTEKAQHAAKLAALGGAADDPAALDAGLADAEAAIDRCQRAAKAARSELKAAEEAHGDARDVKTKAETRLGEQRRAGERAMREIAAARALADDATLDHQLAETRREKEAADARFKTEQDALNRANPDAADLELENAESALEQLKKDIRTDEDERLRLRTELNTLGAQGLGEQAKQYDGERERLTAALAAAEREGKAVKLLAATLDAKQKEARENFTGPVRERIKPYLQLVFPDTEIGIDDQKFDIVHLNRDAIDEKFDALSLGTREQIAVLVRLAFAEYLAEHGEAPVVILDDALVNSDPERMRRMLLALRRASQRVQIIVLTCREADYAGLGAPVVRFDELRSLA